MERAGAREGVSERGAAWSSPSARAMRRPGRWWRGGRSQLTRRCPPPLAGRDGLGAALDGTFVEEAAGGFDAYRLGQVAPTGARQIVPRPSWSHKLLVYQRGEAAVEAEGFFVVAKIEEMALRAGRHARAVCCTWRSSCWSRRSWGGPNGPTSGSRRSRPQGWWAGYGKRWRRSAARGRPGA